MSRFERGFTYLWVLLAVALLGLGLAVGVQVFATAQQREQERELLAIGRQFRAAIARYRETRTAAGKQEYPATLDDLLLDRRFPDLRRYLRKEFVDPMTGRAEWGLVRVAGRIVGVHSVSERMPIKQHRFEPENMTLIGNGKGQRDLLATCAQLKAQGFAKAKVLLGGMPAWIAQGQPVVGLHQGIDAVPSLSSAELWMEAQFDANLIVVAEPLRGLQLRMPNAMVVADLSPKPVPDKLFVACIAALGCCSIVLPTSLLTDLAGVGAAGPGRSRRRPG